MTKHQRSNARFLPTYATLVGLPALALLVILRVGEAFAPIDRSLVPPHNPVPASVATLLSRAP